MWNSEAELVELTHKDDELEINQRVYYTLIDNKREWQLERNTKLLGCLMEHLHKKGVLSDSDLDQILWESISSTIP